MGRGYIVSRRFSIELSATLEQKLQRRACRACTNESEIVREALKGYLTRPVLRAYNLERELRFLGFPHDVAGPRA